MYDAKANRNMIANAEQQRRQLRVEELLLRGCTSITQMAAAFGVTFDTITADIREIRELWVRNNPIETKDRADLRIRQIEHIHQLALASYERSRKDREERTYAEKRCDNPKCTEGVIKGQHGEPNQECPRCLGEGKIISETRKITGSPGDPAFLTVAKACVIECARIEGLYPAISSTLLRTVKQSGVDGEILEETQELYLEAPNEQIITVMGMLEKLRFERDKDKPKFKSIESEAKTVEE